MLRSVSASGRCVFPHLLPRDRSNRESQFLVSPRAKPVGLGSHIHQCLTRAESKQTTSRVFTATPMCPFRRGEPNIGTTVRSVCGPATSMTSPAIARVRVDPAWNRSASKSVRTASGRSSTDAPAAAPSARTESRATTKSGRFSRSRCARSPTRRFRSMDSVLEIREREARDGFHLTERRETVVKCSRMIRGPRRLLRSC